CSLETSPCPTLVQHPSQQSIPKLEKEHCPVTSEHHMSWSQMIPSSQPFCPPTQHLNIQAEGLGVHEDTKSIVGFQRTPSLCLPSSQNNSSAIYTGVPFHSVLQSGALGEDREYLTRHYTPLPMLNPTRSGTGLYCNLLPPINHQAPWPEETGHHVQQRKVNIGLEFQAEIPELLEQEDIEFWSEEPLREELLWKPWVELERNDDLLEQVEKLLDLSTSTALPGGVANLELALHSLSLCQGNVLAALEMMFFTNSKPSRDYHYIGSDIWCLSEQKLFHKAFAMYGKDFSFIHKMVQTKGVSQCVEFYYHSKRLREKQRKLKEKEMQQQQQMAGEILTPTNQVMVMNPINVDRLVHQPALAPSFPCKQCG
ncbi:transcriptional-regulating factor 1-like, partial [Clarias magur]